MNRLLAIPAVFLLLLAGAVVWSGGGSQRRADFAYFDRGDVFTLDLNQISYMQDFRMCYAIREGLYAPDPVTYDSVAAGALDTKFSDDKRVWTFKLRPDARWDNGDPVTAHDYVFSYRRMLEEPGEYTYLFYCFKNAEEYQKSYATGKPTDFKTVGITATDDLTLRLELVNPLSYMQELMAFPVFYPRHEPSMRPFRTLIDTEIVNALKAHAPQVDVEKASEAQLVDALRAFAASSPKPFADKSELAGQLNEMATRGFVRYTYRADYTRPAARPGAPGVVTNGPYTLKQWDFKRRLILEKSPTYWDQSKVTVPRVEKVVNDNVLSQFLAYETKMVDWMSDVPGDLAAELREKKRPDLKTAPAFGTMFITLLRREELPASAGGGKNPLADLRVRQALAMSVDKKFIVDAITRIGELPARTYLPPDGTLADFRYIPGPFDKSRKPDQPYSPEEVRKLLMAQESNSGGGTDGPGLPYNITLARKLLAEAGYPDGRGFPPLPILFNSENSTRAKISQALKSQWKQALGLDISLQTVEGKIFKERVSKKDYAIATVAWYGDYADASTFTDKYLSTSLQNDSDWRNPAFDALCYAAQKEPDAAKRGQILSQAEHLIDTEVPIIPIYHYVNAYLVRPGAHGVDPNPRSLIVFKSLRVDPDTRR